MINSVVLAGRMTADPEVRYTSGGTPVMTFALAVNDRRRNKQKNEWEDYPHFFDCIMYGSRAESLGPYLGKGKKLTVSGKLELERWEKNGQKHSRVRVNIADIELPARESPESGDRAEPDAAARQHGGSSIYDEDIPF